MTDPSRIPGFRGECLWELDIVTRQCLSLAEAFPAETYDWRPDPKARSVSEVFVHVASGNFMLLDMVGLRVPEDLYGSITSAGSDRFKALMQRNDELVAQTRERSRSPRCCVAPSPPPATPSRAPPTPNSIAASSPSASRLPSAAFTCACWPTTTNPWAR